MDLKPPWRGTRCPAFDSIPAIVFSLTLLILSSPAIYAESPPPELSAPSYILADAANGTVLLQRNIREPMPPASLSKLMTLHLVMDEIAAGRLSSNRPVVIPERGSAAAMRPGSSVLGLKNNDKVDIGLLLGSAAAVSANDAAWTLAILSSGNPVDFVSRMNEEAEELGMNDTHYVDPDGWSSLSTTTAADQLILAREYINRHPEALVNYHSLKNVRYEPFGSPENRREKANTNMLVGRYPGADGLKTGTIAPEFFHFIATAKRENTRLIAVIMGISSNDYFAGFNLRATEAASLLDWGFDNWTTYLAESPVFPPVRVRHGKSLELSVVPSEPQVPLTIRRSEIDNINLVTDLPVSVEAPIASGTVIGRVCWYAGSRLLESVELRVEDSTERRWRIRDIFR